MFEVPPTYYLNYYITLEIPFSDIQYSFHNSSSRSSHHPCLVSVLQPASPSSPFCQASFLPYSYPAAHWKEESLHPYLYSESGKFISCLVNHWYSYIYICKISFVLKNRPCLLLFNSLVTARKYRQNSK